METQFQLVPAESWLDAFLQRPEHRAGMRHVIVTNAGHILGAVRINTGLRSTVAELGSGITFGDVANQRFTIVRESDVAFDVINRLWRKNGVMALVVRGNSPRFHIPRPADVIGVITKKHVADAVAAGIQTYPQVAPNQYIHPSTRSSASLTTYGASELQRAFRWLLD